MQTTPTPGAVRAAKRLWELYQPSRDETERIIDEETHAGELVTALRALFEHCAMVHKCWGDSDNTKEADAAIKSARAAIATATKE